MGVQIRFTTVSIDRDYIAGLDRRWMTAIRGRFADRENIGRERVYELYFANEDLPEQEVFECFDLIETEYGAITGLLRPEDSLEKLFQPVATRNPFRSMTYEIMAGDRQLWLGEDLRKQMRRHGVNQDWPRMETIGDFVRAWCGRKPSHK